MYTMSKTSLEVRGPDICSYIERSAISINPVIHLRGVPFLLSGRTKGLVLLAVTFVAIPTFREVSDRADRILWDDSNVACGSSV